MTRHEDACLRDVSERGFDAFVRARHPALLRLTSALAGDRHTGEDLAQATWHRLWPRWNQVAGQGDPWAYTRRIAVSLSVSWSRRRWRTAEVVVTDVPDSASPVDGNSATLDRLVVAEWLAALPARQRAVVVLRFLEDLPVAEVAAALGCSEGTVKSQTSKALAKLTRELDQSKEER